MFELAGAIIIGLLTVQGIKLVLARGIFLGSRRQKPERDAKRRPVGWTRTEQTPQGQQPPEQEREAERWRHRLRKWAAKGPKKGSGGVSLKCRRMLAWMKFVAAICER